MFGHPMPAPAPASQPAAPKGNEAKPAEAKKADDKPADAKPAEAKPAPRRGFARPQPDSVTTKPR